jgi:hypothetical protein
MAKKTETASKTNPNQRPVKKTESAPAAKDLAGILDSFFDRHLNIFIWLITGLTFLFGLLLFDPRISLAGDDSAYIIRAYDFIHSFKYPGFQGPLYPIVLSLLVGIFGISLVPLKVFSLLSVVGFVYLFFHAFRGRIPSSLLVFTLLAVSINSFILYYASQTYNEAFYMLVQMAVVFVFFRKFIDTEGALPLKAEILRHLLLAASLLALVLTKNVGYSAVFAVTGYFVFRAQWKNLLFVVAAFALMLLIFQGIKTIGWGDSAMQFSTQGSGLTNKDYYNPQAGKEDLSGYINRVLVNSDLYLSRHFMAIIGFRKAEAVMSPNTLVTLLVYLMSLGALGLTYRKNRYLFFTGLVAGAFLLVSFIILQTKWDQSRLIIPAVPYLLLLIFSFFYYGSSWRNLKLLQLAVPVLAVLVLFQSLGATGSTIKENSGISGKYGGLTPDWKNYVMASEWAAQNLPPDAIIACRKPSISFIYGNGRNFFGIMALPNYSTEKFLSDWSKNESALVLYDYKQLGGKPLTPDLYKKFKENMQAMIFLGDTVLIAEKLPDSSRAPFLKLAADAGISGISTVNDFKAMINRGQTVKLYYPDSLLDRLQKVGVTHVLTANIRRNSAKKDGMIVNTVERYMAFIQEKYPEIFTKVSQAGEDDNEPASILKIEYDRYGRKPLKP